MLRTEFVACAASPPLFVAECGVKRKAPLVVGANGSDR